MRSVTHLSGERYVSQSTLSLLAGDCGVKHYAVRGQADRKSARLAGIGRTMNISELANFDFRTLTAAYKAGTASPVEALSATLIHAERVNPQINALFHIDGAAASR